MDNYTLTIMRNEPNPKYDPMRGGGFSTEPQEISRTVLQMEVTPEQFDRIRAAALQEAK